MAESPRIVFMGTPDFAARILGDMLTADWNVAAAYTRPDSEAGRGLRVRSSAVKELALKSGLPLFQPRNFREQADIDALRQLEPDFLVVASYGLILPDAVLAIPKIAPLNLHASLLPRYRGAAPIQRAIEDSWRPGATTGISLMRMVREMDAGPVYATREVPLAGATVPELTASLAQAGSELLRDCLRDIASGKLLPAAQNEADATYAPRLTRADGEIDWRKSAPEIDAFVRAMNPWPGARATFAISGKRLPVIIRAGRPADLPGDSAGVAAPGQILNDKTGLVVACGSGGYQIELLQPEGRKAVSGRDFANGRRLPQGVAGMAELAGLAR